MTYLFYHFGRLGTPDLDAQRRAATTTQMVMSVTGAKLIMLEPNCNIFKDGGAAIDFMEEASAQRWQHAVRRADPNRSDRQTERPPTRPGWRGRGARRCLARGGLKEQSTVLYSMSEL